VLNSLKQCICENTGCRVQDAGLQYGIGCRDVFYKNVGCRMEDAGLQEEKARGHEPLI
jgi:hypothetical protein